MTYLIISILICCILYNRFRRKDGKVYFGVHDGKRIYMDLTKPDSYKIFSKFSGITWIHLKKQNLWIFAGKIPFFNIYNDINIYSNVNDLYGEYSSRTVRQRVQRFSEKAAIYLEELERSSHA